MKFAKEKRKGGKIYVFFITLFFCLIPNLNFDGWKSLGSLILFANQKGEKHMGVLSTKDPTGMCCLAKSASRYINDPL